MFSSKLPSGLEPPTSALPRQESVENKALNINEYKKLLKKMTVNGR
jgi:hypothetical protein